ncbi:hypothetical protein [Pyxidicoccus trucidator]|uniref:hypothetical protein n=1 Tax=Pyxidicoccus trucidator TaxID=2709662 RepID=UPI0013DC08FA|nr:hypothetical protein [Pyxidicoccus trucidator]
MGNNLRDEVIRLLSPHMLITSPDGAALELRTKNPGSQDSFSDLTGTKQNISFMALSEGKRAGIVMYGDASFSIDAYEGGRFPSFAHFVATVIVHETRRAQTLRGVELELFVPEKGWKTLFGHFAKGVTGRNIFSGRKRLGDPSQACRIMATGNEQLYAMDCSGTYATLLLQTS